LDLDPLQLLVDRAAVSGLSRQGSVSCGGTTRLLRTVDGWIGVALPRPDDVDAVPAWLEVGSPTGDPWPLVEAQVRDRRTSQLVMRARLLGLPVAPLARPPIGTALHAAPVSVTTFGRLPGPHHHELVVVDLSTLWAGPLCSQLLRQLGARVIKVESSARPDGGREGLPAFFDLLNGGKEGVALDFRSRNDVELLRQLVSRADVVIEGSRPRALEQLGITAAHLLSERPAVWVSITGYGRRSPGRDWVAFGDDAAVAGGLVVYDEAGPCFCADAVADPLTGLVAAAAALDALTTGRSCLLDVAMGRVAASFAGPTVEMPETLAAPAPVARPVLSRGPRLGQHNEVVLSELVSRL
jgi:hypothetical protein